MLETILIPKLCHPNQEHLEWIGEANRRADLFAQNRKAAKRDTIHNFVVSDFGLVGAAIDWIAAEKLACGNAFCEWGSGLGVVAMMASIAGFDAYGIEVEPDLVDASRRMADDYDVAVEFYEGSFLPDQMDESENDDSPEDSFWDSVRDVENVDLDSASVYHSMGKTIEDFDLIFAFPWPGERFFFENVFDRFAADGALLLTYDGRNGLHLERRV